MNMNGESERIGPVWLPLAVAGCALLLALATDLSETEWVAIGVAAVLTVVLQNFGSVASLTIGQGVLAVVRRELSQEIERVKDLAALSAELAAEITLVPFASLDGGPNSQHDAIYGHAYRRLRGLGFGEREIDTVFSKAAPAIGRRLLFDDLNRLEPGLYAGAAVAVAAKRPPSGEILDPDLAIEMLVAEGVPHAKARTALERYRSWHLSSARMQTFLAIVGEGTQPEKSGARQT